MFTQHARIHGRSRKTLALYEWVFEQVHQAIGDKPLSQLDTMTLRRFLSELIERNWKPTSVSIVHRVFNAFLNWCKRESLVTSNPLDGIPAPKTPKVFPFILDESQVRSLLAACNRSNLHEARNYAMLLLFIDCGLRLNELIGLRLGDVSLAQRSLKVHGKGARDRIVFMGARTAKAHRRWLELRGFRTGYSDALFIDRKGEPLKPRWVQQVIARLGVKAGIKGVRVSPHTLRHTAATLAVKNGMDPFALQRLLGWENISTALKYVHLAGTALREAHAKASPVDRLLET
ncbi:tyrosine-type recombinase/integrase [Candidatus Acetothermia bacterium]|nr:tyrosine-type recombinase/integrase [Candidatus Acetothermia bacterium]MCI2432208.1 tyrosine-type recombinase/integrase [Candidatus Acetothermia bacterium]MCI2436111.1 tyrosine-type recombinase/integrase [Candidatus Acetothermia bacterium]